MSEIKSVGWFLIRSSVLSLDSGKHYLKNKQNLVLALQDPIVRQAIKTTNPSVYQRLFEDDRILDDEKLEVLFDLVSRLTYRSVPFMAYAGISLGEISNEKVSSIILKESKYYEAESTSFERNIKNTQIQLNTTAKFSNDKVEFYSLVSGKQPKYHYIQMQLSKKLINEIKKDVNLLPDQIKQKLLKTGLFWNVLSPTKKKENIDFGRVSYLKAENIEDVWKPVVEASISQRDINSLINAAKMLVKLRRLRNGNSPETIRSELAQQFVSLYGAEEVPLLEFIGGGDIIAAAKKKSNRDYSRRNDFDKFLLDLLYKQDAFKTGIARISDSDLPPIPSEDIPESEKIMSSCLFARSITPGQNGPLFQITR